MKRSMLRKGSAPTRNRYEAGAALAEYGLLVAGITLASLVAVSVLGGKVGGLVASVATLLPGATAQDNGVVQVGSLIETKTSTGGAGGTVIKLDDDMLHDMGPGGGRPNSRLGNALGLDDPGEAAHLYQLGDRDVSN
ncbi:MAG: Flp family type IVb pilin [Myxococcota bacterium]